MKSSFSQVFCTQNSKQLTCTLVWFFPDLVECVGAQVPHRGSLRHPSWFPYSLGYHSLIIHALHKICAINTDSWLTMLTNRISVFSPKNVRSNLAPIQVEKKSLKLVFLASILLHYIRMMRKNATPFQVQASRPQGVPCPFPQTLHLCPCLSRSP